MEYFLEYTTDKHPEKRTFGYYGTNLSDGIEILENYLNNKGEVLLNIKIEKHLLEKQRMEINYV